MLWTISAVTANAWPNFREEKIYTIDYINTVFSIFICILENILLKCFPYLKIH